jgi:hypothetical protein
MRAQSRCYFELLNVTVVGSIPTGSVGGCAGGSLCCCLRGSRALAQSVERYASNTADAISHIFFRLVCLGRVAWILWGPRRMHVCLVALAFHTRVGSSFVRMLIARSSGPSPTMDKSKNLPLGFIVKPAPFDYHESSAWSVTSKIRCRRGGRRFNSCMSS